MCMYVKHIQLTYALTYARDIRQSESISHMHCVYEIHTCICRRGCSAIAARLPCSRCAFAVLSLQVRRAVAARSASELLRGRCTLAARVAHAHAQADRQFYSNQLRSTGQLQPAATGVPPPSSLKLALALVLEVTPVEALESDDGQQNNSSRSSHAQQYESRTEVHLKESTKSKRKLSLDCR